MRPILALILAAGLLAVPLAAAAPNAHATKGQERAAEAADAAGDAGIARAQNDQAHGKHDPALFQAWRATFKALLASWHENATSIREACRAAQEAADDETGEERASRGKCIRDGYKAFLEDLRAQMKAARLARSA